MHLTKQESTVVLHAKMAYFSGETRDPVLDKPSVPLVKSWPRRWRDPPGSTKIQKP